MIHDDCQKQISNDGEHTSRHRQGMKMKSKLGSLIILGVYLVNVSSAQSGGKLTESVQPFVDRGALAGAVMLVADREKTLAVETVGFADIAAKKSMSETNLFWIASMSKPVTGAALMILVDEGKVNLDDPVETYLPEFRNQWLITQQDEQHQVLRRPAKKITVRDILRHTSGMSFKSALETPTLDGVPFQIAVRSYAMTPLVFEPGTKYQYSNAGINTAARIIEVVAKKPFEDFLDEHFFRPLGMPDTTFWPNDTQVLRIAKSYRPTSDKQGMEETIVDQLQYPLTNRSRAPMPAGGLFSTAADMALFCQMILNHGEFRGRRYLSEKSVQELGTRQTGPSLKDSYGLGWEVGPGWMGHGGAFATKMIVDHERGLVMVWLVQHAGFPKDGDKALDAFLQTARSFAP